MPNPSPQASIIIGRSSANEQHASLDTASVSGETNPNLGRRDFASHHANNPQDSEGDAFTPAKDFSSPEEANADTSKGESTSTASKESTDSTGQVRPSSTSPKVSTPTTSKWQYTIEKFRRDLTLLNFLDLLALKSEVATRVPKELFRAIRIASWISIHSVWIETAVEFNPGHVFAARSAYGQELSTAFQLIPKPLPYLLAKRKIAVHGEDEDGNPCVFWVPRGQVLSPDPSIPKPLSGNMSVSDLDTSPPILLPSNAVDFDSLGLHKTSESPPTSGTAPLAVSLQSHEFPPNAS
ncbi:hypothetical protein P9112_004499 [Eukaryota sp. TZLM1-RC]